MNEIETKVHQHDVKYARLEALIEQIDRHLTHLETGQRELQAGQRWIMGLMFTSWMTIIGLILFKLGS
ncbi:MAG: hypothetical protein OXH16_13515 [Gemmatimonadetes bacterium]|nr:hypothetical protein [Gemmatimonadota bacterium]